MGTRPERVASAIKREISQIIQTELRDPRISFVTVTSVKMTRDLKYAHVSFSVLGDEKVKKNCWHGLNSAKGYIQCLIGDRLKLRFTPKIVFKFDETSEFIQRMDEILRSDETTLDI